MVRIYTEAEEKVLSGQAYTIGGQSVTRANLAEIRKGRQEWQGALEALRGIAARKIRRIIPLDI